MRQLHFNLIRQSNRIDMHRDDRFKDVKYVEICLLAAENKVGIQLAHKRTEQQKWVLPLCCSSFTPLRWLSIRWMRCASCLTRKCLRTSRSEFPPPWVRRSSHDAPTFLCRTKLAKLLCTWQLIAGRTNLLSYKIYCVLGHCLHLFFSHARHAALVRMLLQRKADVDAKVAEQQLNLILSFKI